VYGAAQFEIGGERITLGEDGVTDLEILCYYAYSPLYTGSSTHREIALANRCTPITIALNPPGVTLAPGATQQFAATVRGTTDPRVNWTLPNGGGTISSSGLFTASLTPGNYLVRAKSVVDSTVFADATITVAGGAGAVLSGSLTLHAHTSSAPGLSTDTLIDVTLTAEPEIVEANETPTFVVTAVSGTGKYTAEATSNCNRSPEVSDGTAVAASLIISDDLLVARLAVTFRGTRTHTSCTDPTTTTNFEGTLSDGRFVGTPVIVNGVIVAIDFGRSENSGPPSRVLVQTGRLVR
jgi:hypothetical protein